MIGQSARALSYAQRRLTTDHFPDTAQKALFILAENFAVQTGGAVLTREAMSDALRNSAPGRVLFYEEYWDSLSDDLGRADGQASFIHSVNELRERAADRLTGDALAQSMEILTKGADGPDGQGFLKGHADARSWAMGEFSRIEQGLQAADAPEGDMRRERAEIAAAYSEAESERRSGQRVIATGIPSLDIVLGGGLRAGELDLVLGFTTVGKTGLCCQTAWDAVVRQGKNVVYFTTETLRQQVRVKILSRHTRQFAPAGLNSRDIKAGTLATWCPFDRHDGGCRCGPDVFNATLEDFTTNPAYGHLQVAQVPRGATMSTIGARLDVLSREWEADLVIVDYLMLLRSETHYRTKRETLAEIVNEAKAVATTYRGGRGTALLSPWQANREGWQAAKGAGRFELDSTAETAEARNTADLVMSMLATNDSPDSAGGRNVGLAIDVLKNRDGERGSHVSITADYATSCFVEATAVETPDEALGIGDSE